MSDKELEFIKDIKNLFKKYNVKIVKEYGYYDEVDVYFDLKGENCRIDVETIT